MTAEKFREPTRLILTDDGVGYFFARKQRLQRFRLHDGREDFGLQLSDYTPSTLQKLIASGLVRKLEFPIVDAVVRRHVIIDYVKLIQYGIFYYHARTISQKYALSSPLATRWNRKNPRAALGGADVVPTMHALFSERSRDLAQARTLLEMRIRSIYSAMLREADVCTESQERDKLKRTAGRLVEYVSPEVWFLWLLFQNEEDGRRYIQEIATAIARILRYTTLADYLALLIIELMVHMQHQRKRPDEPSDVLYLLTQFSSSPTSGDRDTRSQYLLSTGTTRFEALQADLHEVQARHGRRRSIEQFYNAVGAGDDHLSLYYTSFLKDACDGVGASFESSARDDGDGGLLNLVLTV